jgi:murein DD-endopeptidase MepM/ murein hydrolase activator NlpD
MRFWMRLRPVDHPTFWLTFLRCYGHWLAVGIVSLGILLVSGILTHSRKPQNTAKLTDKKPTNNTSHDEPPPSWATLDLKLKRGDTLSTVLARFDLDGASAHEVAETIRPLFNPRKLRAGETLRLRLDPQDQSVQGLEYTLDSALLRVMNSEKGWSAELREIPFVAEAKVIHGSVTDSLYEDGIEVGLTPLQILKLASIFESEIDFFSDIQKGDLFSVAFKEITYADGRQIPERVLAARITTGGESFHAIYYRNKKGDGTYYDLNGRTMKRAFLRAPLSFHRISSTYRLNRRHPIFRTVRPHRAIDYAAPTGTPVVAIGRGRVSYAGWKGGYGKMVELRHANGYVTRYGHFSRIAPGVHRGRHVDQGDVIGYVGQSGHATGPHLHFEILRGGKKMNFLRLKLPPGKRLKGKELERFNEVRDRRLALLAEAPLKLAQSSLQTPTPTASIASPR